PLRIQSVGSREVPSPPRRRKCSPKSSAPVPPVHEMASIKRTRAQPRKNEDRSQGSGVRSQGSELTDSGGAGQVPAALSPDSTLSILGPDPWLLTSSPHPVPWGYIMHQPETSLPSNAPFVEIVELQGHIVDSLLLPKVLDEILTRGGSYEIKDIRIGQR